MRIHHVYPVATHMKQVGMRIRIDPELRREFIEACRNQDLTAAQVLRGFMRDYIKKWHADAQQDLFGVGIQGEEAVRGR